MRRARSVCACARGDRTQSVRVSGCGWGGEGGRSSPHAVASTQRSWSQLLPLFADLHLAVGRPFPADTATAAAQPHMLGSPMRTALATGAALAACCFGSVDGVVQYSDDGLASLCLNSSNACIPGYFYHTNEATDQVCHRCPVGTTCEAGMNSTLRQLYVLPGFYRVSEYVVGGGGGGGGGGDHCQPRSMARTAAAP